MPRSLHSFDPPDRFVAGTVGQPGERAFFLQARAGQRVVSVSLEKQQVQVLAERVEGLLDEVVRRSAGTAQVPAAAPVSTDDVAPLETPLTEEFRVGTMALGWDEDKERIVIEAHEVIEGEEEVPELEADPDDGPACLRVRLSGSMARAFVKRARSLVSAGRPPCPFCNLPLDPAGHICPRANGYRR
ncbi:MAG: DUF3090 domain-containing protein [Candidatus Nanopelagicales bacterium]